MLLQKSGEEYTSFVINASPMAITGGKSDHNVPVGSVMDPVNAQSTPKITTKAMIRRLGMIFLDRIFNAPFF